MSKGKRYTPEQIIARLCEAELELSKGRSAAAAAKQIWITELTYDH